MDLRRLRNRKGLNQTEVANKIGVSIRTIQYWEKGEKKISLEHANRIAELFEVSVNDLLPKKDGPRLEVVREIEKAPLESIEDRLADRVVERISAVIKASQENHEKLLDSNYSLMQSVAHLTLDIDELMETIEDMKKQLANNTIIKKK